MVTLFLLTSCQPEVAASANIVVTIVAEPTQTAVIPTATLLPPAIQIVGTETAVAMPVRPTAIPTSTPAEKIKIEGEGEGEGEETATETPRGTTEPTFTPPALPFTSDSDHYWLQRPIGEGGTVWTDKTYPYGSTRGGSLRPHHGVEFNVEKGTQVLAAASGTVVVAGDDNTTAYGPQTSFYGNLVVIELDTPYAGQPVYNLYGHLSAIYVAEGQHVDVEQVLALSGASGVAEGPHLHFEVRLGQNNYTSTYNPRLWLYPFPDYGVVAGRVVRKNGSLVEEAPISLNRIDATSRYLATTSYSGTTVNGDPQWDENFVLDDVPTGYYDITVAVGKRKFTQEIYVFPYRTNFVEIVIED